MTDPQIENILNWSGISVELYPLNYIKIGNKIIKNQKKKYKDDYVSLFTFGFKKSKKRKKFAIWHDGLFLYEPGTETIRYGRIFEKDKQLMTRKILIGGTKEGAYFISYAVPIVLFFSEKIYMTQEIILNKQNYDYIIKRVGYNHLYIREVFQRATARYPEIFNLIKDIFKKCQLIERFPLQEKDTSLDAINHLYNK